MNFLAIDTTKSTSLILLQKGDFFESATLNGKKVSENLLPQVDEVLTKHKLKLHDFSYFVCVVGPGSFTGLRIGISTIKAFNRVLNKKLIAVNSFEPIVKEVKDGCILLTCTKKSFYFAIVEGGKIIEMGVDELENITQDKYQKLKKAAIEKELEMYADIVVGNYPQLLHALIVDRIANQQTVEQEQLKPLYLQLSQAERSLKKQDIHGN